VPRSTEKSRSYRSAARATPRTAVVLRRLGRRIRELRLERALTQEALAGAARIDPKHLQAIESGTTNTTVATLDGIARGLRVEIRDLFGRA
jgi:transcriptional regulator with XRE-family HTH domain